jgi:hypothetical protein
MFQQINLYEPIFREQPKLFSAKTICGGLGFVTAGLLAIALFSWWRVVVLDRLVRTVQSQQAAQTKFVERGNSIANLGESAQSVERRLTALAVDLERHRQALRYLRGGERGSEAGGPTGNRGFSGRMAALAHQQLDGLWVTGATFTADTGRFELTGSANSAALVPIYLGRLAGEAALAGIPLQSIEIRQPKKPLAGEIEFSVSSATQLASREPASTTTLTARSTP